MILLTSDIPILTFNSTLSFPILPFLVVINTTPLAPIDP